MKQKQITKPSGNEAPWARARRNDSKIRTAKTSDVGITRHQIGKKSIFNTFPKIREGWKHNEKPTYLKRNQKELKKVIIKILNFLNGFNSSSDTAKNSRLEERSEKSVQNKGKMMINMKKLMKDIVQGSNKWLFKIPQGGD